MRTIVLDIETTGFKADFGRMICAVLKEYHRRGPCIIHAEPFDDKNAVIRLRDKLEDFDILVTHYGKGFDIPFINSRLLILGERRIKKMFHVDTYYIARNKLRAIKSKSLESLCDTFGFDDEKMKIRKKIWNLARDGDGEARMKIIDRCTSDVLLTEELYYHFLKAGLIDTLRKY